MRNSLALGQKLAKYLKSKSNEFYIFDPVLCAQPLIRGGTAEAPSTQFFVLNERKGGGAFGAVYNSRLMIDISTNPPTFFPVDVVIKCLPENAHNSLKKQTQEAIFLQHQNIRVHGVSRGVLQNKGFVFIIMQNCGISLFEYLKKHPKLSFSERRLLALKAINEIMGLKDIVHRDIKPENICIHEQQKNKVYLIDFGLAEKEQGSSLAGTPLYMAPEVFKTGISTSEADIYAFSATLASFFMTPENAVKIIANKMKGFRQSDESGSMQPFDFTGLLENIEGSEKLDYSLQKDIKHLFSVLQSVNPKDRKDRVFIAKYFNLIEERNKIFQNFKQLKEYNEALQQLDVLCIELGKIHQSLGLAADISTPEQLREKTSNLTIPLFGTQSNCYQKSINLCFKMLLPDIANPNVSHFNITAQMLEKQEVQSAYCNYLTPPLSSTVRRLAELNKAIKAQNVYLADFNNGFNQLKAAFLHKKFYSTNSSGIKKIIQILNDPTKTPINQLNEMVTIAQEKQTGNQWWSRVRLDFCFFTKPGRHNNIDLIYKGLSELLAKRNFIDPLALRKLKAITSFINSHSVTHHSELTLH